LSLDLLSANLFLRFLIELIEKNKDQRNTKILIS
jgi:hypothetical protein